MSIARLRPYLAGWAAYALFYFAFGFHPGLLASDDFGYLRSVLGTLAAHRPYAYAWLEPYAATYSGACALLYGLTGSLLAAAWGFQAFCALAFYPLLARLLAARLRPGHAALLSLAIAACPLWFAKAADFQAAFCTLDLVLLALLAFEARRWGWFFLAAFLAFANRQNQICLLILPWAQALRGGIQGEWVSWKLPRVYSGTSLKPAPLKTVTLWTLAWAAAALLLVLSMNRTYASAHAAYRSEAFPELAKHAALAFAAGGFMVLGWLSLGSLLAGRPGVWRSRWAGAAGVEKVATVGARFGAGFRARWPYLAATAGLLALIPAWGPSLLRTDTPLFGLLGWRQVNRLLPWALLALLPALDLTLLRRKPYPALLMGYVAIASVRGIWWDYYFLEIALIAILMAVEQSQASALPRPALAALALCLVFDMGYGFLYKIQSDKQALSVSVLERLQREGKVPTEAMSGAPFGFLGWKLFDYYIAHDGRMGGNPEDFLGYVRRDRVLVETGLPWRSGFKAALPAGADSLAGGECRIGFAKVRYRVADVHGSRAEEPAQGPALRLDPRFRPPPYPLDDAEWRALIQALP
jgi:hypothetical protein